MKKFCPKCGKETNSLLKGLCKDCFLKEKKPAELPALIEFEKCRNCEKAKLKGKQVELNSEFLKNLVLQNLRNKLFDSFSAERIDFFEKISNRRFENFQEARLLEKPEGWKAVIKLKGKIDKAGIAFTLETLLKPKTVLCDACMKVSSGYYEATLQLRFSEKNYYEKMQARILEVEKFLSELSRKDSLAKIVKVSKVTNGVDLQIGSKRAAKLLARKFAEESREKITVSSTLAGIDRKGHEWSRFTYCVRL